MEKKITFKKRPGHTSDLLVFLDKEDEKYKHNKKLLSKEKRNNTKQSKQRLKDELFEGDEKTSKKHKSIETDIYLSFNKFLYDVSISNLDKIEELRRKWLIDLDSKMNYIRDQNRLKNELWLRNRIFKQNHDITKFIDYNKMMIKKQG
jgi:hypothetical protein